MNTGRCYGYLATSIAAIRVQSETGFRSYPDMRMSAALEADMSKSHQVAIAGATGRLGRELVRVLVNAGYEVCAIGRDYAKLEAICPHATRRIEVDYKRESNLIAALEGVDWLISCLGASVIPMVFRGARTFRHEDVPANLSLIKAARAQRVGGFTYISVFGAHKLPNMEFIRVHEQVVGELHSSRLPHVVIRPTGFFTSMEEILTAANWGFLPEYGDGLARTNPIHEADLAKYCLEKLESFSGSSMEFDVGGPDILTRREISEIAQAASGKSIIRVPAWSLKVGALAMRPFSPRASHLMSFISEILKKDYVAPPYGTERFADYFQSDSESGRVYSVT
jgi:uncharacterized protein YbjT (DUF2867 family)